MQLWARASTARPVPCATPGNKDEWGPRIAQGKETLYKHAMEGFTGSKGAMPARGGNAKLTDEEVKAAVDFMADQSV